MHCVNRVPVSMLINRLSINGVFISICWAVDKMTYLIVHVRSYDREALPMFWVYDGLVGKAHTLTNYSFARLVWKKVSPSP
jgi:hypothetical protein